MTITMLLMTGHDGIGPVQLMDSNVIKDAGLDATGRHQREHRAWLQQGCCACCPTV